MGVAGRPGCLDLLFVKKNFHCSPFLSDANHVAREIVDVSVGSVWL